jgi:hypothetical protein
MKLLLRIAGGQNALNHQAITSTGETNKPARPGVVADRRLEPR